MPRPRQAELDALMESHKNVTDLTAGGEWHEFTYCVDSYLTVFRCTVYDSARTEKLGADRMVAAGRR